MTTRYSLNPDDYSSGSNPFRTQPPKTWQTNIDLFEKQYGCNPQQYVEIKDTYHRNFGSIGVISKLENFTSQMPKGTYLGDMFFMAKAKVKIKYVLPDGKVRTNRVGIKQINWLPHYTGPVNYVDALANTKEEAEPTLDRLGRQLEVGQFVSYILHHFEFYGAHTYFGKITRITKNGIVYCKNIALDSDDKVDEKKVNDNTTILIMNDDLMNQIMIKRLSV